MKQKLLKQLAHISMTKGNLDPKKVSLITARLKKKDIRTYVKALELLDQQQTVTVESPIAVDELLAKELQVRFADKKIDYIIKKDLLAGMRIIDNDILYDYSLDNKIDKILEHMYELND